MCTKDPFLRQWNPSILKSSSFMLSLNIVHSIDRFIVSKMVVLDQNLGFKVYVGDVTCDLRKIGYKIPPTISSSESLVFLLNSLSGSKLCFGCQHVDFSFFGNEIIEGTAGIIGRMKCLSSFDEMGIPSKKEERYFSLNCHALVHQCRTKGYCEACESLDKILRLRLFRLKSNEGTQNDARKANHRYLSIEQLKDSLRNETLLRRNAERREQYAKKKIDGERQSRQLTIEDHKDMSTMFSSIKVSEEHNKLFANKPEMELFWSLQKEMIDTRIAAGNFLLNMAILLAGGSISKTLKICSHIGLCSVSAVTFSSIKS